MITITKHGKGKINFLTTCKACGCEFTYEIEDIQTNGKYIQCPECQYANEHDINNSRQIDDIFIKYPVDDAGTLYRAKQQKNGKWVEGCLLKDASDYFILDNDKIVHKIQANTIGKYSGMTVIENECVIKLFEGDIIKRYSPEMVNLCIIDIKCTGSIKIVYQSKILSYNRDCYDELVGNIYDSPNLLRDVMSDNKLQRGI